MKWLTGQDGLLSIARLGLALTVLVALVLVVGEAAGALHPSAAAYSLLATLALAFVGWVAGPRIAQYLLPQLGGVVGALSQARTRPYGPATVAFDYDDTTPPDQPRV